MTDVHSRCGLCGSTSKQLRAEIIAHSQAQTTVVSIALTATAALAGVAFGTGNDAERLEILLAVPLVLTGLGLTYLAHSVHNVAIGQYIGQRLWPALAAVQPDDTTMASGATVIHSWEKTVADGRRLSNAAKGVRGWLSVVPGLFLFGFPSVAALAINYELAWFPVGTGPADSGLQVAWFLESLALVLAACMLVAAGLLSSKQLPSTDQADKESWQASATLEIIADLGDHHATGTAVLRRVDEP